MYISRETAQEIVEEIGGEIGAHINLMDERGYIIASTDASRIGNLHEEARRIIQNHLPELYITREMENAMTKKGINLPLVVDENVVGVVGITGDREKVYGYGNIVRRMTEILIADSIQKDAKRYERRQRYYLLEEWLDNPGISRNMDFQKRAAKMGIDVTTPHRVMILLFKEYQELSDTFEGQRLLEQMEASIRHEAEKAAAQAQASGSSIVGYDELDMELFLNEISYNTMEDYIHKLFGNVQKERLAEYMKMTEIYFVCEGSIIKMAEKLYIHKNTVQYKLKKMAEETGRDIRQPSDTAVYYMAWKFHHYMQ